jgi:arsenate reductase-like glutaredoxin family protein
MPYIDIDIEIYEFVRSCTKREIKELIEELIENDHLPKDVINTKGDVKKELNKKTSSEIDFEEKLDKLKLRFFSLSKDEEESLEKIFKKHL